MTSNNGLSLTNTRDVKANTIYLNYNSDIIHILEIFAFKNDVNNIIGLVPTTLDTSQKLAEALGNNHEFDNFATSLKKI